MIFKVLRELFVMLHPLMPHLTEELWHAVTSFSTDRLLALEPWPEINTNFVDPNLEQSFSQLFESIRLVRNLRAEAGLKPSQQAPVLFLTKNASLLSLLRKAIPDIQALTRANKVEVLNMLDIKGESNSKSLVGVSGELEVILPIEDLVDLEALRSRLQKDFSKAEKEIATLSNRLDNPSFVEKAPDNVVEECRGKLSDAKSQLKLVSERLSGFG